MAVQLCKHVVLPLPHIWVWGMGVREHAGWAVKTVPFAMASTKLPKGCLCACDFIVWLTTWDTWNHEAVEAVKWTAGAVVGLERAKRSDLSEGKKQPGSKEGEIVGVGQAEQERRIKRCFYGESSWEKSPWWCATMHLPSCTKYAVWYFFIRLKVGEFAHYRHT